MSEFTHLAPTNSKRFHLPFLDEDPRPAAPVIVRCDLCPNWQAKTTVKFMRQRYESHRRRCHT